MKKFISIILFIFIVILVFGVYYKNNIKAPSLSDKLSEIGYSNEDIQIINSLNNPSVILEYDYNKNIISIIQNENFKEENINKYIEFSSLYSFDLNDIIYVVNNNFYDKEVNYNDKVIMLMKQTYFIYDNLKRYLDYKEINTIEFTNQEAELKYIISMVNSNRDYEYYTNVIDTDLSKGFLILVNKYNKLSSDYVPDDLVMIEAKYGVNLYLNSTVYNAFKEMWQDAYNEGLYLYIRSPYRSYNTQNNLYERYAAQDGYDEADTYSARPGYSEHQTGLAFDVTSKSTTLGTFENTEEFKWMKNNAYKYGFILRYPKGKENITGYIYESWHYRYVGKDVAKYIYENDLTFEEYYEYYVK